jgi:hypothetical protein
VDRSIRGSFPRFRSRGPTFLLSTDGGGETPNDHGEAEAGGDGTIVLAVAKDAPPSFGDCGAFAADAPPDAPDRDNNSSSNNNSGMFVSLPSGNPFLARPEEVGFVLAPIIFCVLVYLGSTSGGLGVDKARTFTDWGGVVALYAVFALYIGGVMLYVMAARNRREDIEMRGHLRRMDRLERLGDRVEDSIFRLLERRWSAWWPWDRRAIDLEINAAQARLEDLQAQYHDLERLLTNDHLQGR